MDPIGALFTALDQSFRQNVLVPLALVMLVVIGVMWLIGSQRAAQEKAVAFGIGMAVILGAARIVTWLQGAIR